MFFVYFLRSLKNKKIYTGFTKRDVEKRLNEHNIGTNDWTKNNGPFELAYYEAYHCEKDARSRESFYKTGLGRLVRDSIISAMGD